MHFTPGSAILMYRMMIPVASHRLWFVYFCRCNSYPSREQKSEALKNLIPDDLGCNSYPSREQKITKEDLPPKIQEGCNSYPSREQKISYRQFVQIRPPADATLTPHGNRKIPGAVPVQRRILMQLLPLTGTEKIRGMHIRRKVQQRCNSYPSREQKRRNIIRTFILT